MTAPGGRRVDSAALRASMSGDTGTGLTRRSTMADRAPYAFATEEAPAWGWAEEPGDAPAGLVRMGQGLMAIPPVETIPGANRNYFLRMNELFVDIRRKKYDNVLMAELSMGMSSDYEEAVRCGATIVRLGTAIFGPRNYDKQEAPRDGTHR